MAGDDDFAARVLAWWDTHGRKDLPWQHPRTPYRVWVSEVMLQQTRAGTVVPYFERFMAAFPTVQDLAAAGPDQVLHLWSGLGYYARARNLHDTARRLAERPATDPFPRDVAGWMELPGVGRSTAGAVVAQAFGQRAGILDANVRRVLARHHRVVGPISSARTQGELWRLAEQHTPTRRVADYTQAIMDLGATVCRSAKPVCNGCPVQGTCAAHATGEQALFPQRAPRKSERRLERRRFFVITAGDLVLLEKRPEHGIWGGLWSPPERAEDESMQECLPRLGIDVATVAETTHAAPFRHGFSHYDLDVLPVYVRLNRPPAEVRDGDSLRWARRDDALGLSAVAARLIAPATPPQRSLLETNA